MTATPILDRATAYDNLVSLLNVAGVSIPKHVPDGVAFDWLCKDFDVLDLRAMPQGSQKPRGRVKGVNKAEHIEGVTIHQSGTLVGGDDERWQNVPCHAAILYPHGRILLLEEFTALMHHGHALNRKRLRRRNGIATIGIEVECRADGVEGDPKTFWRSERERFGYEDKAGKWHPPKTREQLRTEATDAQLRSLVGLLWFADNVFDRELPAYAHRQGDASRTSDPGSRIWKHLLREGVRTAPDECFGTGTIIPAEWRLS